MSYHVSTVGFTFKADIICPACVARHFDIPGEFVTRRDITELEDRLSELATARGYDYEDHYTFDSDEFPKPVPASWCSEEETCGTCHMIIN